ncbi:uncharacterized protein [Antedon mediterranea]|uniref:uncharacterized protein n=1 Tax=Antedon mediterranea TaxID=105859 RepID=UPI003AF9FBA2
MTVGNFIAQEIIILGDFNVNILNCNRNNYESVTNFCNIFGLEQLITEPTRISDNNSSAIDLIFASDPLKIKANGVIPIGLSDHFLTFCRRKRTNIISGIHRTIDVRSMKNYSSDSLTHMLNSIDWSDCISLTCVQSSWDTFKDKFLRIIDSIAPKKKVRVKVKDQPWFDSELRDLRDKMLIRYLLKGLGTSKSNNNDKKQVSLEINNEYVHDKKEVAEEFNSYFTNVAGELVNKLDPPSNTYNLEHVNVFYSSKGVFPNDFSFIELSEDNVLKALTQLSTSKATGIDTLPAKFFKDGASAIAKPLTHIIKLSFTSGIVPKEWKLARVIPIHKKGSKTVVGNYRPVSLLSAFSKVVERLVHDQLMEYLNSKSLIYDFQCGFRANFSTDLCLIHLTDHIKKNWDKGNLTDNRLSLHLGKTYSILFGSKRKLRNQPELKVTCNDYIITNKPTVSYLGLELDNNLTGDYIACGTLD